MPQSRRYLTWPNAFTFARLCCLPFFWWLLIGNDQQVAAGSLLGFLAATDWVDGYLARRLNQISEFGKVFDPVVDRLLFLSSLIALIIDGRVPVWFCIAVGIREFAVGATMTIATLFGMQRFDVTLLGKRATFALMCALPWLLVGSGDFSGSWVIRAAGWIAGIPGLFLSYVTAIQYVPKVRSGLKQGRDQHRRGLG
jgi:cardiolipin synthase (CMP-forming)